MSRKINVQTLHKDLLRANALIWKADRRIASLNIFLQALQALLPVVSLYYIKEMIEAVVKSKQDFAPIIPLIITFSAVQFLLAMASQLSSYISGIHQQKLTDHLSASVLQKAIEVDYEYYENPAYHDTLHLAQQQSLYKATQLLSGFNAVILNSLSLIFLVGFFFTLHSNFALVFVLLSLPLAMIKWYSGYELVRQERKFAPMERESNYLHQVLTGVSYAKETRVFGYGHSFIEKFKNIRYYIHIEKKKLNVKLTAFSLAAETIEIIVMAVIFFMLARNAWEKSITAGVFVIYIQGFQRLQSVSKNFLQSLVQLLQQKIFLQDLFAFFDIDTGLASTGRKPFPLINKGLVVTNLSFVYPGTEKKVLQDVHLHCRPGQVIAIVGENGSGKSTLVKLLARLYHVQKGHIAIDDNELENIGMVDYRRNSIFLFQDFEKYFFTVEENIALADTDKQVRPASAIKKAAELAGIDHFIHSMANGYQTRMGRVFEGSQQLSGGQWQKLALARVFYKDARLIVLDEPTSSIDASAELEIFQHIKEQVKGKLIILITHRLYNLKIADHIYVMKEGRIAEKGNFDELIEQNGIFKTMYEAQKL